MIDYRYPPQSDNVIVPLYKSVQYLKKNCKQKSLIQIISHIYDVCEENIFISKSASYALILGMDYLFPTYKKLGIPIFFCPHLTKLLINNKFIPVFYDYVDNFSQENLQFLLSKNIEIIIWPNFFGERERDKIIINTILEKNIILILDDAQSFPFRKKYYKNTSLLFSMISFGKNKFLSSKEGGALISHKIPISHITANHIKINKPNNNKYFSNLKDHIEHIFSQTTEDTFINNKLHHESSEEIISNYELFLKTKDERRDWWNILNSKLPFEFFKCLKNIDFIPSIMAVYVQNRFKLASFLNKKMIQSTWYYFPLSSVSSLKSYSFQSPILTLDWSSKILIIPWSIHHDEQDFKKILNSLIEYENN